MNMWLRAAAEMIRSKYYPALSTSVLNILEIIHSIRQNSTNASGEKKNSCPSAASNGISPPHLDPLSRDRRMTEENGNTNCVPFPFLCFTTVTVRREHAGHSTGAWYRPRSETGIALSPDLSFC